MKTVRRNAHRQIKRIFDEARNCRAYSLDYNFEPQEVSAERIREQYNLFDFAKLIDEENGTYRVRVHSNLWYEFEN